MRFRWWCALRRWGVLLPLLLPLAAIAARLPVPGLVGKDDRRIQDSDRYPWSAIGRLNFTTGGFCTATVIGPRRVLTAAHCLWNRRTARWYPPCALHFLAAYRRGAYKVHALVAAIDIAPGYRHGKGTPDRDWAVLTLDRDVSAQTGTLPVGNGTDRNVTRLLQAGYSRDHLYLLTINRNCRRIGLARKGRLILHDCDATFGDSGSLLLVRDGKSWRIVGSHVGFQRHKGRTRSIAVSSGAFADWLDRHPARRPSEAVKACSLQPGLRELLPLAAEPACLSAR